MAFNGERKDPLSGVYHLGNGYRGYSPVLMCFNCPDSWSPFESGGINAYAYCFGDPINHADPSGHLSLQSWGMIALGILGIAIAIFTAGESILAACSVSAALSGASAISMIAVFFSLAADATSIASTTLEKQHPQASTILGWVSFAAGLLSLGHGIMSAFRRPNLLKESHDLMKNNTRYFSWGGRNHNAGEGFGYVYYYDTYKNNPRLNIAGHGFIDKSGKVLVDTGHGIDLNPRMLYERVTQQNLINEGVKSIRLNICYSARGKNAFIDEFSRLTQLPVKGYINKVYTAIDGSPGKTLMDEYKPGEDFPKLTIYKEKSGWSFFSILDPYEARTSDPSVFTL